MLLIKDDKNCRAKPDTPRPLTVPLQYSNAISLSNLRIIQKHLVYVIGLSEEMASNEVLGQHEYFGQYGSIQKIAVNKTKVYNKTGSTIPNYSAYISFSLEEEASLAILVIDNFQCGEYLIRASYGTTKYCTFFLKGSQCPNKECLYYHMLASDEDIINKEDMNSSSNVFYQQQKTAMRICNVFSNETKAQLKLLSPMNSKTVFPVPYTVYQKDIVIKNDSLLKTHHGKPNGKLSIVNGCNYLQSKHQQSKPIEFLIGEAPSFLFNSKIAKVKSLRENRLTDSSSFIQFEKLKVPNQKRKTFGSISYSSNSLLFRKHQHSRFTFPSSAPHSPSKEANDDIVPDYVSDLIGMTLSRFSFFKKFNNFSIEETEQLLCNTFCHHQTDTWSQFILDNINNNKVTSQ